MIRSKTIILALSMLFAINILAQSDTSAIMDLESTTKGFLLPRMTLLELNSIANPANGLLVFCTDDDTFYAYITAESKWKALAYAAEAPSIPIPAAGYSTPASYPGLTSLWSDDFNAASLDTTQWNYQIGDGCPNLCGWGNNELQSYQKENTILQDGYLIIEAKEESQGSSNYTSSRLTTQNKFSFNFGRVDIRAALPIGQGIWPALWMLGDNITSVGWPACGEIDIMEMIGGSGRENEVHGTTHWWDDGFHASYGGSYVLPSGIFNDEFHVFSIVWNQTSITWYVDDIQFHVIDITPLLLNEFMNDFHFLINVAVGGNWPGNPNSSTTFPQYLIVDYIRVFQ